MNKKETKYPLKVGDEQFVWEGNGVYLISEAGVWLCGRYDSVETATLAFKVPYNILNDIWNKLDRVVIVASDLKPYI